MATIVNDGYSVFYTMLHERNSIRRIYNEAYGTVKRGRGFIA